MKKFLLLMGLPLIFSCKLEEYEHKVIFSKTPYKYSGKMLEKDYCRYFYKKGPGSVTEFIEKCDKYNIGDTLKGL